MSFLSNTRKAVILTAALGLAAMVNSARANAASVESLIVAGGCFWCVESDFESVPGVIEAVSGYTGGHVANPTYKQVGKGNTGHYEAVKIDFDPAIVDVDTLLSMFLRSIDPTDDGGQFCDRGAPYRTAIFASPAQKSPAQQAIAKAAEDLGRSVVTPILAQTTFYAAEDYHQDYYKGTNYVITRFGPKKQKEAYKLYRDACGRDDRVKELWGKQAAFTK